jgi:hypothetical protein
LYSYDEYMISPRLRACPRRGTVPVMAARAGGRFAPDALALSGRRNAGPLLAAYFFAGSAPAATGASPDLTSPR